MWVCANSPTAPGAYVTVKAVCACQTSHQETEGAAQRDYSRFHLLQLYHVFVRCMDCCLVFVVVL